MALISVQTKFTLHINGARFLRPALSFYLLPNKCTLPFNHAPLGLSQFLRNSAEAQSNLLSSQPRVSVRASVPWGSEI